MDLFKGPTGLFDSMVFSEVLEHMEDPRGSLEALRGLLAPQGRLFVNMPINSPAPDHLFNADTPEDLEKFIVDAGFKVLDRGFFPGHQPVARGRAQEEADHLLRLHRQPRRLTSLRGHHREYHD